MVLADKPALVVLAAGLGSRFGGAKQLAPVGPDGSTLMDYSVFDAARSGFGRVVFVLRPGLGDELPEALTRRYGQRLEVRLAWQRVEDLSVPYQQLAVGRDRPWGTGQAVLAAGTHIQGNFAVLNADDFYGRDALEAVAGFLRQADPSANDCAVLGYRLGRTASEHGGVSRAVLEIEEGPARRLRRIREIRELKRVGPHSFVGQAAGGPEQFPDDVLVSMNLWGLTPGILNLLSAGFRQFLEQSPGERAEYYLPEAIAESVAAGAGRVRVLPTESMWCGITHRDDLPAVRARLAALHQSGAYPPRLWP